MGHREFLLCDNKLTQITSHPRFSDTRKRPPHRGFVQVGFEEVEPHGVQNLETLSRMCSRRYWRSIPKTSLWRTAWPSVSIGCRGISDKRQVEEWQAMQLSTSSAKLLIYQAFMMTSPPLPPSRRNGNYASGT